jgi:hypothetical protein
LTFHTFRGEVCGFYLKAHNLISHAKDCCSVDDPMQLAKGTAGLDNGPSDFEDGENALREKIFLKQSVKDRACQVYGRILPLSISGAETVKAVDGLSTTLEVKMRLFVAAKTRNRDFAKRAESQTPREGTGEEGGLP